MWINETTFWAPGGSDPLTRVAHVQDDADGISEMPHVLINQARVHDMFLDLMRHSPTRWSPTTASRWPTCASTRPLPVSL